MKHLLKTLVHGVVAPKLVALFWKALDTSGGWSLPTLRSRSLESIIHDSFPLSSLLPVYLDVHSCLPPHTPTAQAHEHSCQ